MTTSTNANIGQAYLTEARRRLAASHEKIRHCLDQLDDAQVWRRPRPAMNSIANLVLHLCGNLRQWLVAGIGGAADVRNRPQEFAERGPISREHLLRRLGEVVAEADSVLARVTEPQLLEPRRIQGFDETVLSAIFNSVSHLAGHTQEIVYATRLLLGDLYQFAWTPATPEQGARPGEAVEAATDALFEQGPVVPVPPPVAPAVESATPVSEDDEPKARPSSTHPLGDYVRDIGREFQEEEDENKFR
jgi:hypothetical protein